MKLIACGESSLSAKFQNRIKLDSFRPAATLREEKTQSSSRTAGFAVYQRNFLCRRTVTRPSFFSFSKWCDGVDGAISVSAWISPTTMPSGWALRRSYMMRSRGSIPITVSMSAKRMRRSVPFLDRLRRRSDSLLHSGPEHVSNASASTSQFYNTDDIKCSEPSGADR